MGHRPTSFSFMAPWDLSQDKVHYAYACELIGFCFPQLGDENLS